MSHAFETYFRKYHQEQLHLWMLITHPDYRRRGAGSMLCNWGLKESSKRGGWNLTVMSSPMGQVLYQQLGYELLGTECARVRGESESVEIGILEKLAS